jgi:hypothetical protein
VDAGAAQEDLGACKRIIHAQMRRGPIVRCRLGCPRLAGLYVTPLAIEQGETRNHLRAALKIEIAGCGQDALVMPGMPPASSG